MLTTTFRRSLAVLLVLSVQLPEQSLARQESRRKDPSLQASPTSKGFVSTSLTDSLVKKLSWELESRKSVEVRVVQRFQPVKPVEPPKGVNRLVANLVREHYIETADGKRLYDQLFCKDEQATMRRTNYCDGKRCAEVAYKLNAKTGEFDQTGVVIKRHFSVEERTDRMEKPDPLQLLNVGRIPLSQALAKATYLGDSHVNGFDCARFLFPRLRLGMIQDQVYHLEKTSGLPVKVESFANDEEREKQRPIWFWEADSLTVVQGHAIPLKSHQREYNYTENYNLKMDRTFDVELVKFNEDYPDSTFWPTISPDANVLNSITNELKQTPRGKKERLVPSEPPVHPIRATQSTDWSTSASRGVFGLGLILLALGITLRRRRR